MNARVLSALHAIALIVSARLLLLLAVCFGFYLAVLAQASQTIPTIGVLVAWCVLTILPLVALDYTSRTAPTPK